MNRAISVVIPNYNGLSLFPETLPTVLTALENSGLEYEVIVSDDCSTDDSIPYLEKNFPQVKILKANKNAGFSVTANRGIHSASYNLVLLLNSDVKLEPGYFQTLLVYFDKEDTFGVTGRIVGWNDDVIQDAAKYPSFQNAKIKTFVNYLAEDVKDMEGGLYTMYLSGANALIDRKKFLELGGFNELFSPFYVEDYELSLRAWRKGWKCYYEHHAVCRHRTSTSIKSKSKKNYIKMISNRNKWFLHAIHLSYGKRLTWMIQLIPEILIQTLLLKTYYILAFSQFLKKYGEVKKSRQEFIQNSKGKSLKSVEEVAGLIRSSVKTKPIRIF